MDLFQMMPKLLQKFKLQCVSFSVFILFWPYFPLMRVILEHVSIQNYLLPLWLNAVSNPKKKKRTGIQ